MLQTRPILDHYFLYRNMIDVDTKDILYKERAVYGDIHLWASFELTGTEIDVGRSVSPVVDEPAMTAAVISVLLQTTPTSDLNSVNSRPHIH
jgi:hypothetical protein